MDQSAQSHYWPEITDQIEPYNVSIKGVFSHRHKWRDHFRTKATLGTEKKGKENNSNNE